MYFNFIPLLIILISKKVIKYISYFFKKSVSKISQINMADNFLSDLNYNATSNNVEFFMSKECPFRGLVTL